jgi:predicted nucleic acid-binding protein
VIILDTNVVCERLRKTPKSAVIAWLAEQCSAGIAGGDNCRDRLQQKENSLDLSV